MMTNPMLAFGREPEQTGHGILKDHDSPLQQHKRKKFACERVQGIGTGQLGLLLLGRTGDPPRVLRSPDSRGTPRPKARLNDASTRRSGTDDSNQTR